MIIILIHASHLY
jgi:chromosome segregation ATPase